MAPNSRFPQRDRRQQVHKILHELIEEVENQWVAKRPSAIPDVDVPAAARKIVSWLESGTGQMDAARNTDEAARNNLSSIFNEQSEMGRDMDMSPNEAADFLRMSRGTLNKMLKSGALAFRTRKVGAHTRILRSDVEAYWDRLMQTTAKDKAELVRMSEDLKMYGRPKRTK